jgi:hypothetical protein
MKTLEENPRSRMIVEPQLVSDLTRPQTLQLEVVHCW